MIKEYYKKDGTRAYMFKVYLGKDEITGKERHTTRRGFKTKREARLELAKIQTQANQNGLLNNQHMTFEELYKLWLEGYQHTVKASTLHHVEKIFKNTILPNFGNLIVRKITTTHCQKVANDWVKQYKSYKNCLVYTKKALEYAVKMNVINANPFKHIQTPKRENYTQALYYNKEELQSVLSTLKGYDTLLYTLIHVLAFTGCRIGEILALTWEDVDTFNLKIDINKTIAMTKNGMTVQTPKTKKSKRTISIDTATAQILEHWRNFQRSEWFKHGYNTNVENQLIFSSLKRNTHLFNSEVAYRYQAFCRKYDIRYINLHGFRHTHASLLFEAKATIKEVQDRLGHSDIKTTMDIYTHVTEKARDKTAETFAKYMSF